MVYTPAELAGMKPTVFKSASPFVIAGGLKIDSSTYPPVLQYPDSTSNTLLLRSATYVTKSVEAASNNDRNHTMPSGIQAGDILVMCQSVGMVTGPGYGVSGDDSNVGTGFTRITRNGGTTPYVGGSLAPGHWYWKPGGSNYDMCQQQMSYKIAQGNESNTTIGGFSCQNQSNVGYPRGHRTLYVFRPTYSVSSVEHSVQSENTGVGASSSFSSHSYSLTHAGSVDYATIGVVMYACGVSNRTATIDSSIGFDDTTQNNSGTALSTIFTGAFTSKAPTPSMTTTTTSTTSGDSLVLASLTLLP